jgi:hypothetical protein
MLTEMGSGPLRQAFRRNRYRSMNLTHLHLALNHVPVLGTVFGLALFAYALWRKNNDIEKVALGVFVLAALLAIPTYFTGEPAEETIKSLPGVFESLIERHESAATIAFSALGVLGLISIVGLVAFRRGKLIPPWFASVTLAVAILVSGLMTWTANMGGKIRHSEIRPANGSSSGNAASSSER